MPRIDIAEFSDDSKSDVIRIKQPKPRNPVVRELFDGRFPPKKHKDKRRSASKFDRRNPEY